MLIILGLILISLIVIVGGDRGVVSLIALVGNLLLLSFAIWLMAAGVPVLFVTVGAGIAISCITLFYQNGTNVKTWSAFISVAITMLVLFFVIYVVIWSTEAGGLNEIQYGFEYQYAKCDGFSYFAQYTGGNSRHGSDSYDFCI